MIDGLATPSPDQLLGVAEQFGVTANALGVFLVIFARIIGIIMMMPIFSNRNIPMTARVGLSLAFAMIVFPLAQDDVLLIGSDGAPVEGLAFLMLLVNQVLVGMMMGLVGAFVMYGIQAGGRLIDNQRGANLGEVIDPTTGSQSSPTGQLTMMLATGLLLATGLHMVMIEAFITSFETLPATVSWDWIVGNDSAVRALGQTSNDLLVIAVKIAAPTLLSVLMTDVLLGLINKAAPQVNVFMFSLPLKAVLGTAALLLAFPTVTGYIGSDETPADHTMDSAWGGLVLEGGTIDQLIDCMAAPGGSCEPAENPPHAPNASEVIAFGEQPVSSTGAQTDDGQPRQGASNREEVSTVG